MNHRSNVRRLGLRDRVGCRSRRRRGRVAALEALEPRLLLAAEWRNPLIRWMARTMVFALDVQRGHVVLDWNVALLNVVGDWKMLSHAPYSNRIVTAAPPLVARNLMLIHGAMCDALNAFERAYGERRLMFAPVQFPFGPRFCA